jgi:uroporphyrinogen-III synthase
MRILLMRAEGDAERTSARLAVLGHAPVLSPVIEIEATGAKLPAGDFDAVIATSANAFLSGDVQSLTSILLYAVGERTRDAAQRVGWTAPIHFGENAQALIAGLRAEASKLQRVLYLAGRHRKPDIEAAAREIGLDLTIVETYVAREIPSLSHAAQHALQSGEIAAALHYSRRSAELFVAAAERANLWPHAMRLRHFALSRDVAEPLLAAGARVHVAAHPDEDHLFVLLA